MQELEPTWGRIAAIWWLLVWRGSIVGFLIGTVVGFIMGVIISILYTSTTGHADAAAIRQTAQLAAFAVTLPVGVVWSFIVLRMGLRKHYKGFRIALVANP